LPFIIIERKWAQSEDRALRGNRNIVRAGWIKERVWAG